MPRAVNIGKLSAISFGSKLAIPYNYKTLTGLVEWQLTVARQINYTPIIITG